MNKFNKIMLSILGGVDTTFYIFTPIMLVVLMGQSQILNDFQVNFIYSLGFLSTIFRAIKIGWLKWEK